MRCLGGSEARGRDLLDRMVVEIQQVVRNLAPENDGVPHRALHAEPLATFEHATFTVAESSPADLHAGVDGQTGL